MRAAAGRNTERLTVIGRKMDRTVIHRNADVMRLQMGYQTVTTPGIYTNHHQVTGMVDTRHDNRHPHRHFRFRKP